MIKKITLKFGASKSSGVLEFEPGPITIFVGPNNSGKSLVLRELDNFCKGIPNTNNFKIIDSLDFDIQEEEILNTIGSLEQPLNQNENLRDNEKKYGKMNIAKGLISHVQSIQNVISWKSNNMQHFCTYYINLFSARLGGRERFELISDQKNGSLSEHPKSNLMRLFQDDAKRIALRKLIYEAFKKYFVIDPTDMGSLKIKLSEREPSSFEEERSWTEKAVTFHSAATGITDFSDGVQSFVGIVMATFVGDEKYLFVDEADAFLHPPLLNMLGKKLSKIMNERNGNLLASTHESSFVMGCIESGYDVNIIRLTYNGSHATARLLHAATVQELFRNPLLRATKTIEALFYSCVVVTEADSDRAFYNEINSRLLAVNDQRGIENCLFMNAQNKQTIWDILKPLRSIGIPCAAIVDIDIVKDGGKVFTKILKSCGVPEQLHTELYTQRNNIDNNFKRIEASKINFKKSGGAKCLSEKDRIEFNNFSKSLQNYGVFIVENGELESWLPELQVKGHSPAWLVEIFDKMGSNPKGPTYSKPSNDDVWEFIGSICKRLKYIEEHAYDID